MRGRQERASRTARLAVDYEDETCARQAAGKRPRNCNGRGLPGQGPGLNRPGPSEVETTLRGQQAAFVDLAQALDSVVRTKHRNHATRPGQIALALADAEAVGLVGI